KVTENEIVIYKLYNQLHTFGHDYLAKINTTIINRLEAGSQHDKNELLSKLYQNKEQLELWNYKFNLDKENYFDSILFNKSIYCDVATKLHKLYDKYLDNKLTVNESFNEVGLCELLDLLNVVAMKVFV